MYLKVTADGASAVDLMRGAAAAQEVFAKAGIEPIDGARGWAALEAWDINSFLPEYEPPEELGRCGDIWLDAQSAAISTALEKLPVADRHGYLELILSEAEQEQYFPIPD
jgi:hypothetical protein